MQAEGAVFYLLRYLPEVKNGDSDGLIGKNIKDDYKRLIPRSGRAGVYPWPESDLIDIYELRSSRMGAPTMVMFDTGWLGRYHKVGGGEERNQGFLPSLLPDCYSLLSPSASFSGPLFLLSPHIPISVFV